MVECCKLLIYTIVDCLFMLTSSDKDFDYKVIYIYIYILLILIWSKYLYLVGNMYFVNI